MNTITLEILLELHHAMIKRFGGSSGVRVPGLLESALYAPFQTFAGIEVHDLIEAKAAKLACGLVKNHPF